MKTAKIGPDLRLCRSRPTTEKKSVMQVQSCFFATKPTIFLRFRCRRHRRCLSSLLL